jgi:2-oxo-3-hexenedioate decarboxylase
MATTLDIHTLAADLLNAHTRRTEAPQPTARDAAFDLDDAYAVESEIARLRTAAGRRTVGIKVGYANRAVWRALKMETLVWGHMYDDTVRYAEGGVAMLDISGFYAPRIEPEIVFKMKNPLKAGQEPAGTLQDVEWLALGFEIIDCVYPGWQFQPADFVAALGLHAALVVGEPVAVTPATIPTLVEQLPAFKLRLSRNGELVEEGSGRNSLRSPALCLGELGAAMLKRGAAAVAPGELVSSGTLTTPTPVRSGDTWLGEPTGLPVPALTLRVSI